MSDSTNWLGSHRPWFLWPAVLAAITAPAIAYELGQRNASARPESANCHAGDSVVSCELDDGWTVGVSGDVMWSDSSGDHDRGRPSCLPPGADTRTTLWILPVDVDGMRWRHVLRVEC